MSETDEGQPPASSAVLTVPNLISFFRILSIPVFVAMILHHPTSRGGLLLFGGVAATDWVDGTLARRTGKVTELGKLLDPVADRLAIAAGLIALAIRGAFPWWAAAPILARDVLILAAGGLVLGRTGARIDVRFVGKAATFSLMSAIGWVSWGNLGMPLPRAFLAIGWTCYGVGIVEYAIATVAYASDMRRAIST